MTGFIFFCTNLHATAVKSSAKGMIMRHPGVEPGSQEPESWVLSITLAAQPNICTQQYNILF